MPLKRPRKVLVIGVGRFGGALVDELWETGCDIIVIDKDPEAIDHVKSKAGAAYIADASDPAVLDNVGARDVDVAVVTAGESFEDMVLCVSQLVQLEVKVIYARAANDRQAHVLERVGATRAVQVENEMGRRLAVQVLNPVARELLDFATHFRVVPWVPTAGYIGKTLAGANFRKLEINVLGYFASAGDNPKLQFPVPEYVIEAGHTLLLVGTEDAVERFLARA